MFSYYKTLIHIQNYNLIFYFLLTFREMSSALYDVIHSRNVGIPSIL